MLPVMGGAVIGLAAALAALPGTFVDQSAPLDRDLVAPLPWDECGDAELPDWREPRLLVVLSDEDVRGHILWTAQAGTAFALYTDGTVFTREIRKNQFVMRRSILSKREVDALMAGLDVGGLLRLPERLEVASSRHPGMIVQDGCREGLVLNLWVDGCRRTVAVTNLTAAALDVLDDPTNPRVTKELRDESREALASLPRALASALRTLIEFRPPHARPVCRGPACFEKGRTLPNQVAWRPE
jgi:hypothetical protein